MWYKYETHLHTSETSACARASAKDQIEFYAREGYAGVVVTDHFLNGNTTIPKNGMPWEEQITLFCKGYENAKKAAVEFGLDVYFGLEYSYHGADFCTYGITPDWLLHHPEIMEMSTSEYLDFVRGEGGVVIQAHPFREAPYIDAIRLFPRHVDGVEIVNIANTDFQNGMAKEYAKRYGLRAFAGSDNHRGFKQEKLAGIKTNVKPKSYSEFINLILENKYKIFEYKPKKYGGN